MLDGTRRRRRRTGRRDDSGVDDDRLRLIFTCCHPALALEARVALTLRTLAGLTTPEIARAFLVPEPTMAQRLVRAKQQDPQRRHPVPGAARAPAARAHDRGARACSTCSSTRATPRPSGADLLRQNLCAEAIRLARTLAELMPDEPEALGLLALMLLHDARRDGARRRRTATSSRSTSRTARAGTTTAIDEGVDRLDAALRREQPGPYQVQAAIAACHATAPTADGDRLGRDRRALRRARAHDPVAGRRAQPRRRGRDGRRPGGRPPARRRDRRRRASSTATTCSPRPAPTCSAGSTVATRPRAAYRDALALTDDRRRAPLPPAPARRAGHREPRRARLASRNAEWTFRIGFMRRRPVRRDPVRARTAGTTRTRR